jgi:hypothetical protein
LKGDERFSKLFEPQESEDMRGGLEKVKDVRAQGVERLKEKNGID